MYAGALGLREIGLARGLKEDRDKGGLFRRSGSLWLSPPTASGKWVRERPLKRQRAGVGWVSGEMFQCAAGFPHIGSGWPKVGVGQGYAGAATYPLRAGPEAGRWER